MKALLQGVNQHRRFCAWIAMLLFSALAALAQSTPIEPADQNQTPPVLPMAPSQQPQERIRALAVAEMPGAATPASTMPVKVYPVLIFYKGRYHDAGLYEASPVPMALEQGTVYEVEQAGNLLGLVTIQKPHDVQDSWFASASWVKSQKQVAAAKSKTPSEMDDERPTLKRPTNETSGTLASANSSPSSSGPITPAPQAETQTAAAVVHHAVSEAPPDPNRPILRHGKPGEEQAADIPEPASAAAGKPSMPAQSFTPKSTPELRDYVAISDPGAYDTRTLAYPLNPKEKQEWMKQLAAIADRMLEQYASSKGLMSRNKAIVELDDFRAFDLFSNNDAQLVMTASRHFDQVITRKQRVSSVATSVDAYVTIVAYRDFEGNINTISSSLTDSSRLDVDGRLQLVDAVDVNADGRGELLFRRIGLDSDKFELYRVGAAQLFKLFEGTSFAH